MMGLIRIYRESRACEEYYGFEEMFSVIRGACTKIPLEPHDVGQFISLAAAPSETNAVTDRVYCPLMHELK